MPEACENIDRHFEIEDEGLEDKPAHFPIAFLVLILSFSLILFIEKIAAVHTHSHGDEDDHHHEILVADY